MAQDGPRGQQDAAASHGGSRAPRRMVICDLNECVGENNNVGSEIPEGADSSKGNGGTVAVAGAVKGDEGGSAPASHTVAALSKGKNPAADAASSKGKGSASGDRTAGAGGSGGDKPNIVSERERRNRMSDMYSNLHALLPHVPEKTDKAALVAEAIVYIRALEQTVAQLEQRKRELAHARQAAAALARAGASSSSVHPLAALPMAAAVGGSSSSVHPQAALPMATAVGGSSSSVHPLPAQPMSAAAAVPQGRGWGWPPQQQQLQQQAAAAEVTVALPPPIAATTPAPGPVGFQSWYGPNIVLSVSNDDAYITVCMPRRAGLLKMVLAVLDKYGIDVITAQVSSDSARSMFNVHARVTPGAGIRQAEPPLLSVDIYKLAVSEIMVWLYD